MLSEFNAAFARELVEDAHSLNGDYMRKETGEILTCIRNAATQGLSTITVSCTNGIVEARLKKLGFITKVVYEQRDGDYMVISW